MTVINPFDFFIEEAAEKFPFAYEPVLARELIPYLETEPAGPRLQALVERSSRRPTSGPSITSSSSTAACTRRSAT